MRINFHLIVRNHRHLRNPLFLRHFGVVPFKLSDIGEGIKEVTIKEWFVKKGDKVSEFDDLCEVQSDKATVTITSKYDGVIQELCHSVEDVVQVGDNLIQIETDDVGESSTEKSSAPVKEVHQESKPQISDEASMSSDKILTTPSVRRIAKENNINLATIKGTGKQGRILKEDLLEYLKSPQTTPASTSPATVARSTPQVFKAQVADQVIQFKGIKAMMKKSMTQANEIPDFGYADEIIMDKMIKTRKSFVEYVQKTYDTKITMMPFFIKALSLAITEFPTVNCITDATCDSYTIRGQHNIGFAVDTNEGLIVPNIKNVQDLSILEISQEMNRLVDLARRNKLSMNDLNDGTITLSNIGSIGGTYTKPIIKPPEVLICGMGKVQVLPRYTKSLEMFPASVMKIAWSADHRVVDGATVARFSNRWKSYIEEPESMILHMK